MTTKTAPIETQEPQELDIGPPSEGVAQLLGEWKDKEALPGILTDLKAIHARVEEIHGKEAQEASKKVSKSVEFQQAREQGTILELLHQQRDQDRARILSNPQWSDQYRREQLDALDNRFEQEIQKRREKLIQVGQTLVKTNGRQRMASPTPEIAAEGSLALQRLPHIGPETLVSEVGELLDVATAPDTDPNVAFKVNLLLNHCYRGVLQTKAMESGTFQPAFRLLAETVERHMDHLTFGPRSRVARAIADGTLQNFDFLVNTFGPKVPWDPKVARMSTNDIFVW